LKIVAIDGFIINNTSVFTSIISMLPS